MFKYDAAFWLNATCTHVFGVLVLQIHPFISDFYASFLEDQRVYSDNYNKSFKKVLQVPIKTDNCIFAVKFNFKFKFIYSHLFNYNTTTKTKKKKK